MPVEKPQRGFRYGQPLIWGTLTVSTFLSLFGLAKTGQGPKQASGPKIQKKAKALKLTFQEKTKLKKWLGSLGSFNVKLSNPESKQISSLAKALWGQGTKIVNVKGNLVADGLPQARFKLRFYDANAKRLGILSGTVLINAEGKLQSVEDKAGNSLSPVKIRSGEGKKAEELAAQALLSLFNQQPLAGTY